MDIPRQFKDTGFRFTEIVEGTKIPPKDFRWKKEDNYKHNEIGFALNYIPFAKSYGVVCSYNNLAVIDSDSEELHQMLKNLSTLTVKTGREGGYHYYLKVPDLTKLIKKQSIKLKTPESNEVFGDLIIAGYVIGPGSLHPNGKKYKIVNDADIATVSIEELNEILLPFDIFGKKPKIVEYIESEHLDILKILEINGVEINDFRKTGSRYSGSHPVHGSESGNNFTFNIKTQMWRCWRHNTWGDNLSLIALLKGIVTCEDLQRKNSRLTGDNFHKTIKIAIRDYGLKKKYIVTERVQILKAIKKLKETEHCKEKNRTLYKEICGELGWKYNISNAKRLGHIIHKELKLETEYVHGGNAVIFDDKTIKRLLYLFSRYRIYNN